MGYKAFTNLAFEKGASYVQPSYEGRVGEGRTLISAIAVTQHNAKVIMVWVRDSGVVWERGKK